MASRLVSTLILICFFIFPLAAQSRKEQIQTLMLIGDSLRLQLVIQSEKHKALIADRDNKLSQLEEQLVKRTIEIENAKNEELRLSSELMNANYNLKQLMDKLALLADSISLLEERLKDYDKLISRSQYDPKTSRLDQIDTDRIIIVENRELELHPFEMFDIMLFEQIYTGLLLSFEFLIPEINKEISFDDNNNSIEYDGEFDQNMVGKGFEAFINLECSPEIIRRKLVRGKKYKVIYAYKSDSSLWRRPYPTEPTDGYYIVDIVELNKRFERELPMKY